MSKTIQSETKQMMYLLYDPEDGRILGTYSKYDVDKQAYVTVERENILEAALGASPELSKHFDVLEVHFDKERELTDFQVDPKQRKLVVRKPRREKEK